MEAPASFRFPAMTYVLCALCRRLGRRLQRVLDAGNKRLEGPVEQRRASVDSKFVLWKRYVTFMSSFGADARGDPFPAIHGA